ncbi:MAG TPA: phenylalanine--tRNA ligase subunit beta, partial [Desulfobacteraceae bacterium]|nr:phenylalanine--tRNA ligase subunit beta [Desulfobacteraceae bacterium]
MKVSLSWLKHYIPVEMEADRLAESLTMAGLEVENVYNRYNYLSKVVVGRIIDTVPHPNADRLLLCNVDIDKKVVPVVCGAPNVQKNLLVPVALPGAQLIDGSLVEKGSIRGKLSEGMLCSEAELGLGTDKSGIMILDKKLAIGENLEKALKLSDMVFDIDLTPNRPDCLSIIGIAREISTIQKTSIKYPDFSLSDRCNKISDLTSVTIEAPDLCPRYASRLLFDITVAPSPFWLQDRLMSIGLRPVNNIVDITNFVLMETGQPLHAFDFDCLADSRIVVKVSKEGE